MPVEVFDDLADPQRTFAAAGGVLVVAELGGRIAAMGGFRPADDVPGRVEILRVRVHPARRRLGLGTAIMSTLETGAAARGYRQAWLDTATNQPGAMAFYRSLGYDEIGRATRPEWQWTLVYYLKHLESDQGGRGYPRADRGLWELSRLHRRMSVKITELSASNLEDLARLCEEELVLDRYAARIPGILMRRPHIGLTATQGAAIVGACIGSAAHDEDGKTEGFIDLLIVGRASQRQGIGRGLAEEMEHRLTSRGCQQINLAGNGPHYAWPGIDIHYTAAVCFAEDLGYQRQECEANMDVDLSRAPLDTSAAETRLQSQGIVIRPANASDDGPMQASLGSTWWPSWVNEITAALRSSEAGLQVAVRDKQYVGFCAYGLNRPHEVGPVGTAPELRKLGIGSVLLKRSLADQRDRGLTAAELVWAGPLSYFSRTLNATIGRAFWLYAKDLTATEQAPGWRDKVGLL